MRFVLSAALLLVAVCSADFCAEAKGGGRKGNHSRLASSFVKQSDISNYVNEQIGGNGGNGGSATASGVGSKAVGGNGGNGGDVGNGIASIDSATTGSGLQCGGKKKGSKTASSSVKNSDFTDNGNAQIGGNGGDGGSATASGVGSKAVGGSGGNGGNVGDGNTSTASVSSRRRLQGSL